MTSAEHDDRDGEIEFLDSIEERDRAEEPEHDDDVEGLEIVDEEDLTDEERAEYEAWEASQGASSDAAALPTGERLQKVMAAAGVASRRVCEDLIAAGRVTVNGQRVDEPGRRVDPLVDRVAVDGVAVQLDTSRRYLMLNKPRGVVSSLKDEHGRPDLSEWTERYEERLFNVGRLDYETSGLLLLTNDGELAQVLSHPSFGVQKTYVAKVRGEMTAATVGRLLRGVELEDGRIAADDARVVGVQGGSTMVEIVLHSGRNRIVRRMLEEVGHPVIELVRRQFGPLNLGTLKLGRTRELTSHEMNQLLTLARTPENARKRPAKVRGGAAQRGAPRRDDRGSGGGRRDERPRRDGGSRGGGRQR
ncbi:hypothetical protein GCM10025874_03980 [Arenivirga flava]|uniref:Pseudouridine synthase n=1 Tax=Arenivirga flava TaxID=1930060 RepID=A0AA37UBD1_9MICO|nr:hypothetical protein GCM10025874_03980 [Arenivirga flava]